MGRVLAIARGTTSRERRRKSQGPTGSGRSISAAKQRLRTRRSGRPSKQRSRAVARSVASHDGPAAPGSQRPTAHYGRLAPAGCRPQHRRIWKPWGTNQRRFRVGDPLARFLPDATARTMLVRQILPGFEPIRVDADLAAEPGRCPVAV
ncbi:MAG: hypothetical protein AVDCRST_MAG19-4075 [uncultured Thermomicrobiales bacterium]|uniref:Uncharacterized protein n=1 Tax=uncultured Thermomicrobiales bacterium TaxID=1645740 RepID=A0A6J4VP01_9BACT|nr:MAG: hypothetical protein AVDCRST_MAG19-4075 [uncultured Thermomicrobiales bacterium]